MTGEVVHRDSLGSGVAALVVGDLRGAGEEELIAISSAGEVRRRLWVCSGVAWCFQPAWLCLAPRPG